MSNKQNDEYLEEMKLQFVSNLTGGYEDLLKARDVFMELYEAGFHSHAIELENEFNEYVKVEHPTLHKQLKYYD